MITEYTNYKYMYHCRMCGTLFLWTEEQYHKSSPPDPLDITINHKAPSGLVLREIVIHKGCALGKSSQASFAGIVTED